MNYLFNPLKPNPNKMNYIELRNFIDQLVKEHEQRKLLNELRLEIELLKQKNQKSKWTKNKNNKLC